MSRLVSLREIAVRPFYASSLFGLHAMLRDWRHHVDGDVVDREWWAASREAWLGFRQPLLEMGMDASWISFDRLTELLDRPDCTWGMLKPTVEEFFGRFVDQTGIRQFFSLTVKETDLFVVPWAGWEPIIQRFPETIGDIGEASRCFALSRYAAAVFHSLQVVEAGLVELGTFLKVKDPHSGWTAVSNALNATIKKSHKNRTKFEKQHFAFLEQVHGTTEGLKNAWRNKISHVQGKLILMTTDFGPEVSEEILLASRAFMRRLAEGLPAPKPSNAIAPTGAPPVPPTSSPVSTGPQP